MLEQGSFTVSIIDVSVGPHLALSALDSNEVLHGVAGDADEDGPVHEVEAEEDEGEGYPGVPLNITCSHSPQGGGRDGRGEGGRGVVVHLCLQGLHQHWVFTLKL